MLIHGNLYLSYRKPFVLFYSTDCTKAYCIGAYKLWLSGPMLKRCGFSKNLIISSEIPITFNIYYLPIIKNKPQRSIQFNVLRGLSHMR